MGELRSEIYTMWNIQESLLQQYRGMAITLLGLISAGQLVAISHLSNQWDAMSCAGEQFFTGAPPIRFLADLSIWVMLCVLLGFGIWASVHFKRTTNRRASYVTFFQNALIAEENDALRDIVETHGLRYPVRLLTIFRRLSNTNFSRMSFEPDLDPAAVQALLDEIMQKGAGRIPTEYDYPVPRERHDLTRRFLKSAIYSVFIFFFCVAGFFALMSLLNMLHCAG